MPELPEVEITRRSVAAGLVHARIEAVRLGKPLRWPLGVSCEALVGADILQVGRRGKYLIVHTGRGVLLLHLGMSGSLRFESHLPSPGPHDHFDLQTDQGVLRLHDPRRFGAVVWGAGLHDPMVRKLLDGLGPEPWDEQGRPFDAFTFWQHLRRTRSAIKPVLLQGKAVVGVGNIYASEVLFLAGIHPALSAAKLSESRAARLRDAICEVLAKAIHLGGSTLRDFSDAQGRAGHFQTQTQVYGREGELCMRCGHAVRKVVQGQRSTWFCNNCQKR
jgi:formamidopyrimidine-DNA glycosylase